MAVLRISEQTDAKILLSALYDRWENWTMPCTKYHSLFPTKMADLHFNVEWSNKIQGWSQYFIVKRHEWRMKIRGKVETDEPLSFHIITPQIIIWFRWLTGFYKANKTFLWEWCKQNVASRTINSLFKMCLYEGKGCYWEYVIYCWKKDLALMNVPFMAYCVRTDYDELNWLCFFWWQNERRGWWVNFYSKKEVHI